VRAHTSTCTHAPPPHKCAHTHAHLHTHMHTHARALTQMGIATRQFYKEARTFPALGAPTVDEQGRLRCGAAVGTREADKERVARLVRGYW